MASQVFYRKWRPQSLAEITGREHLVILGFIVGMGIMALSL